ncbi:MAG: RNA polymerase sigma factor [Deltaproteobacteria bacterium]|jgi:RNA polymerase sigma-70 factor (ECF subfamily)|nr:RNA polymerase sigma factor [Deltaproteobacteria bacterium]
MGRPVRKVELGIEDAEFADVYRREVGYVWRTCARLGIDERDLADAVHDVFVVAYRKRDSFERERPARPWLFGIARRVAADRRRRQGRVVVLDFEQHSPPTDEAAALALRRAMKRLPDQQLEAFVLFDLEGYSAPEVAEMLGLAVNTVYSRVRLARERLAAILGRKR